MAPRLRKAALAAHLVFSVGWIGAVIVYLALGIAAATSPDDQTVRATWVGMELAGWYAIVPLAVITLLTGIVLALGTQWGLFRHYWVLISLLLTVFSTVVLLLHMPTVSAQADIARTAGSATLDRLGSDLAHPAIGLAILLVIHTLNVYKPRGMTRYGRRRRDERQFRASGR